jgi:transposase
MIMPGLVWKSINGKKYLVLRWKKRVNGKLKITREIYVGDLENLADIIQNPGRDMDVSTLDYGISAMAMLIDREIGLRETINATMGHHDNGLSPGDYALIFIMNRLSDPRSKSGIHEWMVNDFSSTLFHPVTAQGFWNMMDRFSVDDMKTIKKKMRDRLVSLGYDDSKLFVDGSNFYTYMEENGIAKKGHNKKYRYDLNEISYYIAANYDYIPFAGDSYAGNVPDVKTFDMILENAPEDAILIFDRGYNSKVNIMKMKKRKYLGALVQSDHRDLMAIPLEKDSFMETRKKVYGRDHRIVIYHSSRLEKRRIIAFMKRFRRVYTKVRKIMGSGDSDAMEKARFYLEMENLNETILLPSLKINTERMHERFSMIGKSALFTNIEDMGPEDLIDLYRKRNRVEHCFRVICMRDLASPVYHWTTQKISVHMFFSYLAYMFLALMRMKIKPIMEVYLLTALDILSTIKIVYMARGKFVDKRLFSADERAREVMEKIDLLKIA